MKKIQRILALAAVILLLAMYGSTLVFALSGSENAAGWFKASLYCTIVVPVFLYACILVYRYLKNRDQHYDFMDEDEKNDKKGNGHD